ncbi:MAG: CRISPR-associated endonuclease Cas3'' [Thermoplasmata archaeon]
MTKISEFVVGQRVAGKFGVLEKTFIKEYAKGKFFKITITDGETRIPLKFWGAPMQSKCTELYENIIPGKTVVEFEGDVVMDNYSNELTVNINEEKDMFKICSEEEIKGLRFVGTTSRSREEMFSAIQMEIDAIQEPHLLALLKAVFSDEKIKAQFMECPGAMKKHHAYIGGLLEHTLNVMRICKTISDLYPELDRDLLITAAILHDIGKIQEYTVGITIDTSDAGKFLTHSYISVEIIESKLRTLQDFPESLKNKLYHMILRHHGKYSGMETIEGKVPWVIPEACALYYADDTDARIKNFLQEIEEGKRAGENWRFVKELGIQIYIEDGND